MMPPAEAMADLPGLTPDQAKLRLLDLASEPGPLSGKGTIIAIGAAVLGGIVVVKLASTRLGRRAISAAISRPEVLTTVLPIIASFLHARSRENPPAPPEP